MPNEVSFFKPQTPQDFADYQKAQRLQMFAQMLQQQAVSPLETPQNPGRLISKISPLQGLAKALQGGLASYAGQQSDQMQAKVASAQYARMLGMMGGAAPQQAAGRPATSLPLDPQAVGSPQQYAAALSREPMDPEASAPQSQPTPQRSAWNPGGLDPNLAAQLYMQDPGKYASDFIAPNYKPADVVAQLRAAGIDPNSPQGLQIAQQSLMKATHIMPVDVREGGTLVDPMSNQPLFNAPKDGQQITYGPNGPQANQVPGYARNAAYATALSTAAKQSNTPVSALNASGQPTFIYPHPPALGGQGGAFGAPSSAPQAASGLSGNGGGGLQTTAQRASQEALGKDSSEFVNGLRTSSEAALSLRKSLSELSSLSKDAPASVLSPVKSKVGAMLIAGGVDPESVKSYLGLDPGAVQAMDKLTGSMAVSAIKELTSRGTQFEFKQFMNMNPNAGMTAEGLRRVSEYMRNSTQTPIDQFQEFAKWRQGKSPDTWAVDFPAHWQAKYLSDIDAGKYNSTPVAPAKSAPQGAIDMLKAHPELKDSFHKKYGYVP